MGSDELDGRGEGEEVDETETTLGKMIGKIVP